MFAWLARRSLLRKIGMTPQHARIVGAFARRFNGVWMLLREVQPVDFLGEEMHPFMPFRQGKERISDEVMARSTEKDSADPTKAAELSAKVRKAYEPLLVKSILWPPVSREGKKGTIPVSDVLDDIDLANQIVQAVTWASLEKKTPLPGTSWRRRPLSSTRSPVGMASSPLRSPSAATGGTP